MNRKKFVGTLLGAVGVTVGANMGIANVLRSNKVDNKMFKLDDKKLLQQQATKSFIKHSVCAWCLSEPMEMIAPRLASIGITAIDLVGPKQWDILKKNNLDSSMCNGAEINLIDGFNRIEFHDELTKKYFEMIPLVAKNGYKNLICFSGTRRGMDDETGLKNCVLGLKKILSLAEQHKVVLHMELLNSKVDHKDNMCDNTAWGVELCKRLGLENFKLLYDIYHMQVQEGNVIQTIKTYQQYIGHYHTAGVPGRNEIEDNQELFYPAIMRAIASTKFKGYVAQEFMPIEKDKFASLARAVKICTI